MAIYFISEIYNRIKIITKFYHQITKEKNERDLLHIIPKTDWDSGFLWWNKNCWESQNLLNPFSICYSTSDIVFSACKNVHEWFKSCIKINAEEYPKDILRFYAKHILLLPPENVYVYSDILDIVNKVYHSINREGLYVSMGFIQHTPIVIPFLNFDSNTSTLDSNQFNEIKKYINSIYTQIENLQKEKIQKFNYTRNNYLQSYSGISNYISFLLEDSFYRFKFYKKIEMEYKKDESTLIIDYVVPNRHEIPNEIINKDLGWSKMAETKEKKLYESLIYSITLRTLSEICYYDDKRYIEHICFNGKIIDRSPYTGQMEEKYILSINVSRQQIESLNLEYIEPKQSFKHLKGVSASKLYEQAEIRPIITPTFNDKRFVKAKNIKIDQYTNLAEIDWEDFEHLVRQVFEWEFSDKGGEVNVTQASRDGGMDAIVFDPDPIKGGKIIIQAKRYTNTVPVSAVRDLYGTIINEGANKGISITTSDYGPDSYKFAQGKPITLLHGGHLLYLIKKHGHRARIDIEEAKNNRVS